MSKLTSKHVVFAAVVVLYNVFFEKIFIIGIISDGNKVDKY